jgi:isopentenyl phosphate kinase
MLDSLERSRSVQEVIIINGLESGYLARALSGDNPGTRIYKKNAQRIA